MKETDKDNYLLNKNKTLKHLINKYGTNREYTEYFLNHMLTNHKNNPQFNLYLDSELGSLQRSRTFIKSLCNEFGNSMLFSDKKCLDIGSSQGNSLIAFIENGAIQATGIEIEEGRYQTALININGYPDKIKKKIKIFREDIQNENISSLGQFDSIFCIDVLEHVEDPMLAVKNICHLLKNNNDAFAYIKLRNFQHPENIIHEPHYDLPGMCLLSHDLAKKYYSLCKKDNNLEYEVYQWMTFYDYQKMFKSFGINCKFFSKINPEISAINHIEKEAQRILPEFNGFCEKQGLSDQLKNDTLSSINDYLFNMKDLIDKCRSTNNTDLLEMFYLKYVVFDIIMLATNEQ